MDKEINDGICLIHSLNNEKTYLGHERTNDTDHSEPGMKIACSFVFGTRSYSNSKVRVCHYYSGTLLIIPVQNHRARQLDEEEATFDNRLAISGPGTVGDDLDRFVIGFKIGEIQVGEVRTFQFPKMTEDELKLWQNREPEFLNSFQVQPESSAIFLNVDEIEFIRFSGSRLTMLKETVSDSYNIDES